MEAPNAMSNSQNLGMGLKHLIRTHRTPKPHLVGPRKQQNIRCCGILTLALSNQDTCCRRLAHGLQQNNTRDNRITRKMPAEKIPRRAKCHNTHRPFRIMRHNPVQEQKRISMRQDGLPRKFMIVHNYSFVLTYHETEHDNSIPNFYCTVTQTAFLSQFVIITA